MKTVAMKWLFWLLRSAASVALWRADSVAGAFPRPRDAPSVHASGGDSDRLLLVGSGPAIGYGVLSHDLGLPGHFARQISAATGRGATVDVIADASMTVHTMLRALASVNLTRYDAVVITVGVNDAVRFTHPREWERELRVLGDYLAENLAIRAEAFLIGVQPIRTIPVFRGPLVSAREWHRRSLNRGSEVICRELRLLNFVPFDGCGEQGDRYRSAQTYSLWASLMLPPIVQLLQSVPRVDPVRWTEEPTQRALRALAILDTEPEERFDRIAEFARKLFATQSAVISFIDGEREWMKTTVGFDPTDTVRGSLLVDQVVQGADAVIVGDARSDPRFAANPLVFGPPYLRFYAAHPIESHNGERVGVICVFDARPRQFSDLDERLLRDLAHLVQRELAAEPE